MNDDQLLRYSRQIMLPSIGIEGQERLLESRVIIVGLGGLGSPAAMYLAAAGVGTLVLVDFDQVDLTNLQRQIVHTTARIGELKVESARETLLALNP
ncbi:MAG: ThiF family adenylyltransferase, partial [Candidatus Thiodiazotropha sp.]